MHMRFVSSDGEEGGAVVLQIGELKIRAMDLFGYGGRPYPVAGDLVEVEFTYLDEEDESWEEIFSGNPEQRSELVSTGYWSYRVFGRIVSAGDGEFEPIVSCGPLFLPFPLETSDQRCVGDFVAFSIVRLDAGYRSDA